MQRANIWSSRVKKQTRRYQQTVNVQAFCIEMIFPLTQRCIHSDNCLRFQPELTWMVFKLELLFASERKKKENEPPSGWNDGKFKQTVEKEMRKWISPSAQINHQQTRSLTKNLFTIHWNSVSKSVQAILFFTSDFFRFFHPLSVRCVSKATWIPQDNNPLQWDESRISTDVAMRKCLFVRLMYICHLSFWTSHLSRCF